MKKKKKINADAALLEVALQTSHYRGRGAKRDPACHDCRDVQS